MKFILSSLLASASVMAAALPNPSALVDQTIAQAHARNLAAHYASAVIPKRQAAVEATREEEYRRIEEDMQKWFPRRGRLESTDCDFKIQSQDTSASRPR